MLTFEKVSYRYAGYARIVLHDVDMTLADGEIVGVVGANDAGKSTLCLVASGLAPGSIGGGLTGTVAIDGVSMAGKPLHEFATRVGIAFQNPATQLSGVTGTVFEEVAPPGPGSSARARLPRRPWHEPRPHSPSSTSGRWPSVNRGGCRVARPNSW